MGDSVWRSYREIVQIYGTQYSQRDIDDYWEFMQQDDTQAQSVGFPSGKSVQEKPPQKLDANAQMRQKMQQKYDTWTMHREESAQVQDSRHALRFTSSPKKWDASTCSCGQVFMPDAMYCRQCGKPRGGNTTTAEEDEKPKATEASQAESAILTERIDSPKTVSTEKDPFMWVCSNATTFFSVSL